jgi:hypothetical protein
MLWHPPINPFEQIAELTSRDRHDTIGWRWPDKAAALQLLGEQAHALTVMPENLQKITFATSEHEDVPAERIPPQHLLDLQGKAMHSAPHVGVTGGKPDPGTRRERDHRRRRAFITAATAAVTAAGSTAPLILTRTPPDKAISIDPAAGIGSAVVPEIAGARGMISTGTRPAGATAADLSTAPANCRRHLNSWLAFKSCRRATIETEAPGSNVAATSSRFNTSGQRRRLPPASLVPTSR